jgi:hypothetical protein
VKSGTVQITLRRKKHHRSHVEELKAKALVAALSDFQACCPHFGRFVHK